MENDPSDDPLGFLASEKSVRVAASIANDAIRKEARESPLATIAGGTTPVPVRRTQSLKLLFGGLAWNCGNWDAAS